MFIILLAGKQGNLRTWLSASTAAAKCCAALQPAACSQAHSESASGFQEAARQAPISGKRPSGGAVQKQSKAARLMAGPGQSSLRAFMKPQAAQKNSGTPTADSGQRQTSALGATANGTVRAPASSSSLAAGGPLQASACSGINTATMLDARSAKSHFVGQSEGGIAARGEDGSGILACSGVSRGVLTWNQLQAEGFAGGDELLAEAAANWDSTAGVSQYHGLLSHKHIYCLCPTECFSVSSRTPAPCLQCCVTMLSSMDNFLRRM